MSLVEQLAGSEELVMKHTLAPGELHTDVEA
jgi:hypothetical protein